MIKRKLYILRLLHAAKGNFAFINNSKYGSLKSNSPSRRYNVMNVEFETVGDSIWYYKVSDLVEVCRPLIYNLFLLIAFSENLMNLFISTIFVILLSHRCFNLFVCVLIKLWSTNWFSADHVYNYTVLVWVVRLHDLAPFFFQLTFTDATQQRTEPGGGGGVTVTLEAVPDARESPSEKHPKRGFHGRPKNTLKRSHGPNFTS